MRGERARGEARRGPLLSGRNRLRGEGALLLLLLLLLLLMLLLLLLLLLRAVRIGNEDHGRLVVCALPNLGGRRLSIRPTGEVANRARVRRISWKETKEGKEGLLSCTQDVLNDEYPRDQSANARTLPWFRQCPTGVGATWGPLQLGAAGIIMAGAMKGCEG